MLGWGRRPGPAGPAPRQWVPLRVSCSPQGRRSRDTRSRPAYPHTHQTPLNKGFLWVLFARKGRPTIPDSWRNGVCSKRKSNNARQLAKYVPKENLTMSGSWRNMLRMKNQTMYASWRNWLWKKSNNVWQLAKYVRPLAKYVPKKKTKSGH